MIVAAGVLASSWASCARATTGTVVPFYPGPSFNGSSGFMNPSVSYAPGVTAGDGVAAAYAYKYVNNKYLGSRAVRWNTLGSTELGTLAADANAATDCKAYSINPAGTVVGSGQAYNGALYLGIHAVRWDAGTTAATALEGLGSDNSGASTSVAYSLNPAGTAVGYAEKFSGGTDLGTRAVRWAAGSSAATQLGDLGLSSTGTTSSVAFAINPSGVAVGYAEKYNGSADLGYRPVRWNTAGTVATELDILGADPNGVAESYAISVNSAGAAAGYATKFSSSGASLGYRAVRWDASGTAVTELGDLGTNANCSAYQINDAGTTVGIVGRIAVRWDASGTAATALASLPNGGVAVSAYALNNAGVIVGSGNRTGDQYPRAVVWDPSGTPFDLNDFIDPQSGWRLTDAVGISDTDWISGVGIFDPDGQGPILPYSRAFLVNVATIVPEPSGMTLLIAAAVASLNRRRRP